MSNQEKSNFLYDAWIFFNMLKDLQITMQKMFAYEFEQIEEYENQYATKDELPF
jgi:hypothetical protein